ncbi:DUF3732 domain-containing protein [Actinosynnema sp. NPDC051121]
MHIVAIAVYGKNEQRRELEFRPGKLNILTGKSKTGKSAVLDLVEFCLGRDEVTLPAGIISDVSAWYATLVQIGTTRLVLARPNPETASTNRAMIMIGDQTLRLPDYADLKVNADTTVVREQLSERLGIEAFRVEGNPNSLRSTFNVSVRQALLFCFQKQTEIASQSFLFHRQGEDGISPTIRETLPYFLGAARPEQALLRQQLIQARRIHRRALRELNDARSQSDVQDERLLALVREAISVNLLPEEIIDESGFDVEATLRRALASGTEQDNYGVVDTVSERDVLLGERRAIRDEVREVSDQIAVLESLQREYSGLTTEVGFQSGRLRSIGLIPAAAQQANEATSICPLCAQSLPVEDPTISQLNQLVDDLERGLASANSSQPRRDAALRLLVQRREELASRHRVISAQLDSSAVTGQALSDESDLRVRRAFLKGRITQELHRGVPREDAIAALTRAEREARDRMESLENLVEDDDTDSTFASMLREIGQDITQYARELRLENSEYFVQLDVARLTVTASTPGGRRPLTRVGSAENWVGYHLATHLALHRWFVENDRPVPRFVMFDQPTQAFFPEEVIDANDIEDADWSAVRRQFSLMNGVVESLDGQLQIIVCDHANLADEWFRDAVVDNWRGSVALIPANWLS